MALLIRFHSEYSALGRARWEALRARSPSATIFQSYAWISAWWRTLGQGTPLVVSAWENQTLVGAAALFIDRQRTLRLMGEEHADYGGFLVEGDRPEIYEALLTSLWQPGFGWKSLVFEAVLLPSPLARHLKDRGAWAQDEVPCPRVLFADRSARSLLSKQSLRRHAKLLAREGHLSTQHLETARQIEPFVARFFQQHQLRWGASGTPSLFANHANQLFYRALIEQAASSGDLLFTVVEVDGHPAAMHLGFRSQGQLIWYKPSFEPVFSRCGPGEVLLGQLIEQAAREGAQGIDFTRGDEQFKSRFASEVRHVAAFHARSNPWCTRLSYGAWQARKRAIGALRTVGLHAPVARAWSLLRALSPARNVS